MTRTWRIGQCAVLSLLALAACGGATPKSAQAPANAEGTARPITQGQLKVAHYASGDGVVGFVLDRTGERPKMQMDGEKDIVELTMEEEHNTADRTGWFFRKPDGNKVLYLSVNGSMKIFTPSNQWGLALNSDKDAAPLGPPTVRATEKAPAGPSTNQKLERLAVRSRFTDLKPEDSGNLAKVADAFARATPDMLVHLTDAGAKQAHWAPASNHIGNEVRGGSSAFYGLLPADESWDKSKPGLQHFGVKVGHTMIRYGQGTRPELRGLKGWSPVLDGPTPGLVWETAPQIVFVTVDGGRYELANEAAGLVDAGWGPVASWPQGIQHAALGTDAVDTLGNGGAIAEQTRKEIDALDVAWFDCVNGVWSATKSEIDKVERSSAPSNEKYGKISGLRKKAEESVPTKCGTSLKQLEAGLTKVIEARNVERQAILDKAKARAK